MTHGGDLLGKELSVACSPLRLDPGHSARKHSPNGRSRLVPEFKIYSCSEKRRHNASEAGLSRLRPSEYGRVRERCGRTRVHLVLSMHTGNDPSYHLSRAIDPTGVFVFRAIVALVPHATRSERIPEETPSTRESRTTAIRDGIFGGSAAGRW